MKNEALAKKLLEIIGLGFIRYKPKDNACVLVISPVAGLKKIVNLINGELKTPAGWFGKSSVVGFRLSNSGDTHKIEREMDNRGSKSSVIDANSLSIRLVKEQRLDGSRHPDSYYKKIQGCLRYSLTGLEINYKVKIPSKQINKVRFHSTLMVDQP